MLTGRHNYDTERTQVKSVCRLQNHKDNNMRSNLGSIVCMSDMMHHTTVKLTLVKVKVIVIVSECKLRTESLPLVLQDPLTLVDPGSRFMLWVSFNKHTQKINFLLILIHATQALKT